MKCLNCNNEAVKRGKFCSRSCSSSYNTRGKVRNGKPAGHCLQCDKKLSESVRKYCSYTCNKQHKYQSFINDWLSGKKVKTHHKGRNESIAAPIRRFIFEKYEHRCVRCGWNKIHPVTGKSPLQINHIDGHHKNNSVSNLELLCPNCHSLTPNYGALNRGNGRKNRYAALVIKEAQ